MPYRELVLLLPCHSLEDFPTHHEGEDADGLLASWTGLWHPALIAAAQARPTWRRADDPPEEVKEKLIVAPGVSMSQLPTGFAQRAKSEGGVLIRKKTSRDELIAEALAGLPEGAPNLDPDLVADFLALGYAFLQVQILTRQMHYASRLDEIYFGREVLAAAEAAMQGENQVAREHLTTCFQLLSEERGHYTGVEVHIVDLNLMNSTTIGPALHRELATGATTNFLLSGRLIEEIATREPLALAALSAAIKEERIGIVGGEDQELPLPLLREETILADLRRGLAIAESRLGTRPIVYGRRRYGLTPALPGILERLGFLGAVHATLDDGRFPEGSQGKSRWQGSDGALLDALARAPRDAARPETFLGYAVRLSESLSSDHVATVFLAHWPGQASPWHEDLRRTARYCNALGKFVTVDSYFRGTDHPPYHDRFEPDQYRSPYLKQGVIRKHGGQISRSLNYWRQQAELASAQSLAALAEMLGSPRDAEKAGQSARLAGAIDRHGDPQTNLADLSETTAEAVDIETGAMLVDAARRVAEKIGCGPGKGALVVNPCSFVRRINLVSKDLHALPGVEKPVYSSADHANARQVVVDLPPLGYAWLSGESGGPRPTGPAAQSLAETGVLRNEFIEALINPITGTLQSIHDYKIRGNRLSQQLALRVPTDRAESGGYSNDPDERAIYSVMAADEVHVTSTTPALGEITTKGRLVDREGKKLAGFKQIYRLWRGSRVLWIDIELEPEEELRSDPWNSYYCCRFAWPNESAELARNVHSASHPVRTRRIDAALFIEVQDPQVKTTIFPCGIPYHRRSGGRMLDSILIVRGETARKFRIGIGADVSHPLPIGWGGLLDPLVVPNVGPPSSAKSSWLFHCDAKNVVVTHLEAIFEAGKPVGYRARLVETGGRSANVQLSSFRPAAQAQQVDFLGNSLGDLSVSEGKVKVEVPGYGMVEVEARW